MAAMDMLKALAARQRPQAQRHPMQASFDRMGEEVTAGNTASRLATEKAAEQSKAAQVKSFLSRGSSPLPAYGDDEGELADSMTPDADSYDFHQGQAEAFEESGGTWAPSRESLRTSALDSLRSKLKLDTRKHDQRMDEVTLREHGMNERAKLSRDEGGRPYFMTIPSADGPKIFDARTGKITEPNMRVDNKPSVSAESFLTTATVLLKDFDTVAKNFDPSRVGPVIGRFNTIEQALVGNDPTTTAMYTAGQRIANQLLQVRSGAQVTDQEFQRIARELMNPNQPPGTYLVRLQSARDAVKTAYETRAKFAFGRTTTGDVNQITQGQIPAAPGGAPVSSAGRASAADLIAKYGARK